MRLYAVLCGILVASPLAAQSLELANREVALGASADSLRRTLADSFTVRIDTLCSGCDRESYRAMTIQKRGGGIGEFSVKSGRVASITKFYSDSEYPQDFRRVYTAALDEIHRRGGDRCITMFPKVDSTSDSTETTVVNAVIQSDGTVRRVTIQGSAIAGIELRCGSYRLELAFPYGRPSFPSVWLTLAGDSITGR
jgi:hypothetical protein